MRHIFIVLLILFCLPLHAIDGKRAAMKDSLLRVYLASPPDSTRLEALYQIALLDQLSPTFIYYENKLLEEATAQRNILYQSAAIYAHVIYYYNHLDEKNTERWLKRLEKLAEANDYYNHYFRGKKMMIEFYIINQKVELAFKEAQDMYDKAEKLGNRDGMREAYLCLMTGYFSTLRYKEGLTYLEKAFELIGEKASVATRIDLLTKAVLAYSYLHDNENMLRYLKELESAKDSMQQEGSVAFTNGYANLYLLINLKYSLYYTRDGQPEKAWEYLQKAEKHLSGNSFLPYQLIRLVAYAEYYQLTTDYEKALAYLDEAIRLVTPLSPDDAMMYGLQKANILVQMGCPDDALPLYRQITKSKDSLYTAFSSSQIEQIQTLYNMDKLIQQKEQRQAMFHRICLVISIIVIIALLLFNLHMYRSRKRLQQDENEMRRLAAIAEEANEVKSRFLANMSYNIRIPLNNVVGFSQLLSTDEELDEKERKEYSAIIQQNSGELIQLVNDVLDLSRLEAKMMKFQLQDCNVQEWCTDLSCTIQMHGEGSIRLTLQAETGDAVIHTDTNRLTRIVSSMLLYPDDCLEPREVKMTLLYRPEEKIIAGRIENSPIADPRFASQKVSVLHRINQLFFEHFGGNYQLEITVEGEAGVLTFTYPTLL